MPYLNGPEYVPQNCPYGGGSRPPPNTSLSPSNFTSQTATWLVCHFCKVHQCIQHTNTDTHKINRTSAKIGHILCYAQQCGLIYWKQRQLRSHTCCAKKGTVEGSCCCSSGDLAKTGLLYSICIQFSVNKHQLPSTLSVIIPTTNS